jgi:hypothetical protein
VLAEKICTCLQNRFIGWQNSYTSPNNTPVDKLVKSSLSKGEALPVRIWAGVPVIKELKNLKTINLFILY